MFSGLRKGLIPSDTIRVLRAFTFVRFFSLQPPPPPPSVNSTRISTSDIEALVLRQYHCGKFHDLLSTVISDPAILLVSCRNLTSRINPCSPSDPSPDSFHHRISINDLSGDFGDRNLDVNSSCVKIFPSRKKGDALVLPNLKLKWNGMGRYTAVRYLKTAIHNPSWWFRVALHRQPFDLRHIHRLTATNCGEDRCESTSCFLLLNLQGSSLSPSSNPPPIFAFSLLFPLFLIQRQSPPIP